MDDIWLLAKPVYGDGFVFWMLVLMLANVLLGMAAALASSAEHFSLGETARWLRTKAVPLLIGWGAVKLVVLTAMGEHRQWADALLMGVNATILVSLVGSMAGHLKAVGFPVPDFMARKPEPEGPRRDGR